MKKLIAAKLKNEQLVQEMNAALTETVGFRLWWLGQSGYVLQWNGKRIVMDPYLSDSLTKKYAHTEKPHVRMSELVLRPELLENVAVVTSSHNHTDHLDAETLVPILKNNPNIKFIVPEANRAFVQQRVQCDLDFPVGLNDGVSVTVDGFTFTGVPAKHNELERDANGQCRYLGYIVRFGNHTVYHSGDTLWFSGMEDLLRPYGIDVALLPINGDRPERRVAGNLNAKEAVALGKAIGADLVVPCHYDMFTFNTANVSDFVAEAKAQGQGHRVLLGGECLHMP
ncbi:MBL fold metallo-hydrolase [Maribacter sp. 2307ULW6-5]|uniref:MBL fold metallo-hydrolase n=1 Tax=Maribacter sp. 2307ULW6-5 TaxID=3386275 RepID=UPI0039BC9D96